MKRTLTEWRRVRIGRPCGAGAWLGAALAMGAMGACAATALAQVDKGAKGRDAPAPAPAPEWDAATRQLLKASGLFENGLFKLAADEYADFLKKNPTHRESTNARYALGICHYRLNEYEKAIELLSHALKDEKFQQQRDQALTVIGHAQLSTGHYAEAVATYDELLAKFPKSEQAEGAALNRTQALYDGKQYAKAGEAAAAFLKQYPQSSNRPAGLYLLAMAMKAQDQFEQASATLQDLLSKHPGSPYELNALLLLGQSLETQGKLAEAGEQYRKYIAAAPAARQPDGHYSLGLVLSRMEKYDQAAAELQATLAKGPGSDYAKPARLQLGLVQLAAGKYEDARKTLEAARKDDPANAPIALYGLAQVDIGTEKFTEALARLDELLKLQPPPANAPQIALDHATVLARLGKHEQAAAECAAFLQKHADAPQAPEAIYRQAYSLHALGKYPQSHELASKVSAGKGDFASAAAELDAENLFLMGKYTEASAAFSQLAAGAKEADKQGRFAFRVAQSAYFMSDFAKAAELLAPLASDPKAAKDEVLGRAGFLLGDALLQQGKFAEAAAALRKYVAGAGKGDKSVKFEARYKLGLAELRSNQEPAARQDLEAVAAGPADSPWTVRAWLELGQLAYKQQPPQPEKASDYLKRVMAAEPAPDLAAPALYLLGWIDFDAKKPADAAAKWQTVAADYPKDPLAADAAFHRAVALREAGQQEQALAGFEAYLNRDPKGKYAQKAKQLSAAALTSLNREPEARKILDALASDPSAASDAVLYDLAWAQKGTDDSPAAAATYRKLLKDHPDSPLAPAARADLAKLLYDDKKYEEAAALLEEVAKNPKADPKVAAAAMYLMGWTYDKLGKPEQSAAAFSQYAKAKEADPDRAASALLQAGIAHASRAEFKQSAASLQQMLDQYPKHADSPVAMLKLGEVQADAGDFAASLATHSAFLQKHPDNRFAYRARFGTGWALENQKQYPAARDAYAKVIEATNGETAARAQFQTGETYLKEGKFEEAAKELLAVEYVYAYPEWSARALLEAGRAFEQLNRPDQARKQYAQVVAKYKDLDEAKVAQDRLKAVGGS